MLFLKLQAETDRITNEIQRKKEKENQELEEEKAKMVLTNFSMQEFACIELDLFSLTCVSVLCIQPASASAIISVHILYLKLL